MARNVGRGSRLQHAGPSVGVFKAARERGGDMGPNTSRLVAAAAWTLPPVNRTARHALSLPAFAVIGFALLLMFVQLGWPTW